MCDVENVEKLTATIAKLQQQLAAARKSFAAAIEASRAGVKP